jgi:hypothetical protein
LCTPLLQHTAPSCAPTAPAINIAHTTVAPCTCHALTNFRCHAYACLPACSYDGWVTELKDAARVKDLRSPAGIDNLLYSADTYFSCFADLALTSPVEYFKEGQGSLMQCVITPAAPYMPWTNEAIAAETDKQVRGRWE